MQSKLWILFIDCAAQAGHGPEVGILAQTSTVIEGHGLHCCCGVRLLEEAQDPDMETPSQNKAWRYYQLADEELHLKVTSF